jgi:hypothetical protein
LKSSRGAAEKGEMLSAAFRGDKSGDEEAEIVLPLSIEKARIAAVVSREALQPSLGS